MENYPNVISPTWHSQTISQPTLLGPSSSQMENLAQDRLSFGYSPHYHEEQDILGADILCLPDDLQSPSDLLDQAVFWTGFPPSGGAPSSPIRGEALTGTDLHEHASASMVSSHNTLPSQEIVDILQTIARKKAMEGRVPSGGQSCPPELNTHTESLDSYAKFAIEPD
jgi:hypothetical protein